MTAVTAGRRVRTHPALADAIENRLLRLSRRLAARSIGLADATAEIHDIYVRERTLEAIEQAATQPKDLGDAFVWAEAAKATLEVRIDQQASAIDVAQAERRLGQVLVLPGGRREGPAARPAPTHERDLW
ncbi:MAG: hypothetical protein IE926_20340 [Micrococcales bacterium]|nr:hypothetical protein [Micrococcales bacterium]